MNFTESFLNEAKQIIDQIDQDTINYAIKLISKTRACHGRLFILGVGGSAANASHAVNDFRKIARIEAYAPTDNVAELTARTNDDGWESVFSNWLRISQLQSKDCILVLSVGGGNSEKNISPNIVQALKLAKEKGSKIIGIVSRDGGYTRIVADACIMIPIVNEQHITPHAEAFQGFIWHLMVSHPTLQAKQTSLESTTTSTLLL